MTTQSIIKPTKPSSGFSRFMPILAWLPSYDKAWLVADILAGLTLWGLVVPEGMAYAGIADLPPEAGLYTLVAALLVYALFGSTYLVKLLEEPVNVEENLKDANNFNYILFQNYPNPFNPSTVISYQLPVSGNITLKVFDILGREVATLVDEYKQAGSYEVEFQSVVGNRQLASGIYFYQLKATSNGGQAGEFIQTKKMILLR